MYDLDEHTHTREKIKKKKTNLTYVSIYDHYDEYLQSLSTREKPVFETRLNARPNAAASRTSTDTTHILCKNKIKIKIYVNR